MLHLDYNILSIIVLVLGGILTILLGIITYFIKQSDASNRQTAEHVSTISNVLSVSTEHFKGFEDKCNFKHEIIDKGITEIKTTVNNHELRIIKLENE